MGVTYSERLSIADASGYLTNDGVGVLSWSSGAAAGTLTGTTLAANVVASSLTSVGTLSSLTMGGAITGYSGATAAAVAYNVGGTVGTGMYGTATAVIFAISGTGRAKFQSDGLYLGATAAISNINDNAEMVKFSSVASANNEITISNANGGAPSLSATGGDTNISLSLLGKGTGDVRVGSATATENQILRIFGPSTKQSTLYFMSGTNNTWAIYRPASTTDLRVYDAGGAGGDRMTFQTGGNIGLNGITSPTARLHLPAGTASANTAPLQFTSGTLETVARAGVMEFLSDDYYLTITTGAARKGIVLNDGTALTSGRIPYATTNGRLTDAATLTHDGTNLVVSKASGNGIKLDNAAPTFAWQDMLGPIEVRGTGVNNPAWAVFRTNLSAYQFGVSDECWLVFHVPHDYVPGSDLYIHTHWAHNATTVTGGTVTWGFDVSFAKGRNGTGAGEAFPATANFTVAPTASTTQYLHVISEVQISNNGGTGGLLDSAAIEVDGLILVRVYLSANDITVSGGGVPDPFLFTVDVHYQSTGVGTKQKAPGFYT